MKPYPFKMLIACLTVSSKNPINHTEVKKRWGDELEEEHA